MRSNVIGKLLFQHCFLAQSADGKPLRLSTFMGAIWVTLYRKIGGLCFDFTESDGRGICAATDAVPLPEPKPGAMRKLLVVATIRSREIVCVQRSVVG